MAGASAEIMTTPTAAVEDDPMMMYEPITKQLTKTKIPWTSGPEVITPKQAQQILDEADAYEKLGQRPRTPARIKRWLGLLESNRFAFFNPYGALGFNEDNIVMNGGNRLAAVAAFNKPVGFWVIRNCPTWMVNYIDNGQNRSVREAMFINLKDVRSEVQAIMRLGMRYEEFIFGKRSQYGWVDWSKVKDEHIDFINWLDKREPITDYWAVGKKLKRICNLQAPSVSCFVAYQQLAWPEGQDKLNEFMESLEFGSNLYRGHPALTLREWADKDGYIGEAARGRREGHLLLLLKHFILFVEGHKETQVRAAKGLPMTAPYHPNGWEIAAKNVREALVEMG